MEGKTFKNRILGNNAGFSNRLAYLGRGKVVIAAGHDGAYITTNFGETVEKLEGVTFCKTVGYGAPEKKRRSLHSLYVWKNWSQ